MRLIHRFVESIMNALKLGVLWAKFDAVGSRNIIGCFVRSVSRATELPNVVLAKGRRLWQLFGVPEWPGGSQGVG